MQLICHLVAVVLTLGQTKQIRINIHKRNDTKNTVQRVQNRVNASTHITKTPTQLPKQPHTYAHPHIRKKVHTTTLQDTHQIK